MARAKPPASAEKCFCRITTTPYADDSDYDRRNTIEDVRNEADSISEAIPTVLRQIDAGPNAEGHTNQTSDCQNEHRTDNGIRHAAAGLTNRFGSLREETPS